MSAKISKKIAAANLLIFLISFSTLDLAHSAHADEPSPYEQGVAAMQKNNMKTAITSFDQAIANDMSNWKAFLKRGECLYQLGDYRLAIKDFSQVLTTQPKNADAFLWRANCDAKLSIPEAAMKDYKLALQFDPLKIAVLSQRATFPTQRQQPSSEEEEGNNAPAQEAQQVLVAPSPVTALHLKPELFTSSSKDPNQTLTELGSAISLDPLNPQLLYKRAQVYILLKKNDNALNDLSDAIMNNPNNASYYLARAYVHHLQGNDFLADEDIRQAQFTDPGLPKTIDFKVKSNDSKSK